MCGSDLKLDTLLLRLVDVVVPRLGHAKGLALALPLALGLCLCLCLGLLCEFKFKSCAVAGVGFN